MAQGPAHPTMAKTQSGPLPKPRVKQAANVLHGPSPLSSVVSGAALVQLPVAVITVQSVV